MFDFAAFMPPVARCRRGTITEQLKEGLEHAERMRDLYAKRVGDYKAALKALKAAPKTHKALGHL